MPQLGQAWDRFELLMKMAALAENCGQKAVQHMIAYNIGNQNVKIQNLMKNEEYNIH